jgi:putative holliday junction resolvase
VPGRVLGVDLGSRRVGLALSDPLGLISSPLQTIPMTTEPDLVSKLVALCRERAVSAVVVGLPVSADGTEGPGCARARRIAASLERAGLPAHLVDESWSSRDAEEALRETGKNRRNAKEKVDAMAASLILREFLEESSRH